MFAVLHIADFALHAVLRTQVHGATASPRPPLSSPDVAPAASQATADGKDERVPGGGPRTGEESETGEALVLPFDAGIPGVTAQAVTAAEGRADSRHAAPRSRIPGGSRGKSGTAHAPVSPPAAGRAPGFSGERAVGSKSLSPTEVPRGFAGRAARRDSKRPASDYCPPGQVVAEQLRELNRTRVAVAEEGAPLPLQVASPLMAGPAEDAASVSPDRFAGDPPLALLSGDPKRATVVACSPRARAAGVELGMNAPQALARCAVLELLSPSPAAETEAQAALLAVAWQLSPNVESTAPGVATIDLTALDPGRREPALRFAVEQLAALALPATAGLARTPLLAFYAAHHAAENEAAAASSVLVVADGAGFLAPLALDVATPDEAQAAVLQAWGVHTLGQLVALPKRAIARRLGAAGVALWERAAGETTRPLRLATPPAEFTAALDFEHEVETLEPLLFILRRFVDRLALELPAAGFVAAEMSITLRLADATQYARSFRLPEPTSAAEILFRVLHTHLESVQTAAAIAGVTLRLGPVRPLVRQRGLFESELRDPHGFAETLARVVAIVGSDRVGTPQVLDTHRPDSFALVPPPAVIPPPAPVPVHPWTGVPLRRFRPPLVATVELDGRAPAFVWCSAMHGPVVAVQGPWRSAGDWWEAGRIWEREEWDVELAAGGGSYRLVHTPTGWLVEGEYD